ncbi:hypothetical protein HDV00_008872 [Rhizophlyctis rosea]|nr:hypothetical protein HDV00_008872 [Rhizophlyctis rosea]
MPNATGAQQNPAQPASPRANTLSSSVSSAVFTTLTLPILTLWLQRYANWPSHLTITNIRLLNYQFFLHSTKHLHATRLGIPHTDLQLHYLYHGTYEHNIPGIFTEGFRDWTYLASSPVTSLSYTRGSNKLILCSVLVLKEEWLNYEREVAVVEEGVRVVPVALVEFREGGDVGGMGTRGLVIVLVWMVLLFVILVMLFYGLYPAFVFCFG